MAIFRWGHGFDPFRDFEREVDRLLSSMSMSLQGMRVGRNYPAVNLYELENEYVLTAELPACKPEDLEVTVASGVLTLKGKRSSMDGVPDERYRRQERPRGQWQRSLQLPDRVADTEMTAEFQHGVLKIRLPKTARSRARQIQVLEGGTAPVTRIEPERLEPVREVLP